MTASYHLTQRVLQRAGDLGLRRALNKDENLTSLLKYAVLYSALANGRSKKRKTDATRRRYGDLIFMLRGRHVVDLIPARSDMCQHCLGVDRNTDRCSCTTDATPHSIHKEG